MPNNIQQSPNQLVWINFTNSAKILLVPQISDRPLDQFLEFRDKVLTLVQEQQFLEELNEAWWTSYRPPQVMDALTLELQAFPRAVEVAQFTGKLDSKKKKGREMWGKLLGRASTVAGSVKDIVDNLPPLAKNGLTLFKEVIDIFKGKD